MKATIAHAVAEEKSELKRKEREYEAQCQRERQKSQEAKRVKYAQPSDSNGTQAPDQNGNQTK